MAGDLGAGCSIVVGMADCRPAGKMLGADPGAVLQEPG